MLRYKDGGCFLGDIPVVAPSAPLPPWLLAFTTLAQRGVSSLDFGAGGKEACWDERRRLEQALEPLAVHWLALEHGSCVRELPVREAHPDDQADRTTHRGDAAVIAELGHAAAITTADCLPVVICALHARRAALVHAGWRGLAAGIVGLVARRLVADGPCAAWIGPSIAGADYEVGPEAHEQLACQEAALPQHFWPSGRSGHVYADLRGIACAQLAAAGIAKDAVETFMPSTRRDSRLHSVRRDGVAAGRMATVVALR
ncbi:MAG: polyphenol oxidase family protein [Coriobacteriales bacterium]|jgi:copper oxidase (laccase) domain-containing protein|nr:polyphenol oxidase family protein [Coriobacteriales bacterium]